MDNNYNNYNQQNYNYNQNGTNPSGNNGQGYAITSMVCGICSIVFCWCYGIIGIALGTVALVMWFMLKKKGLPINGMAKAGFICGIVGLALSVITLILVIIGLISAGGISNYYRYYDLYDYL